MGPKPKAKASQERQKSRQGSKTDNKDVSATQTCDHPPKGNHEPQPQNSQPQNSQNGSQPSSQPQKSQSSNAENAIIASSQDDATQRNAKQVLTSQAAADKISHGNIFILIYILIYRERERDIKIKIKQI